MLHIFRQHFVSSSVCRYAMVTAALLVAGFVSPQNAVLHADEAIIIAHRGASGYRPEHTLAAYELGIEQGSDYIEPDLVMTKDGVFVARHDVYLSTTTDVSSHPEFSDRKRIIDGHDDWFIFDFTLAELKTLKALQPFKGRSKDFDGLFEVPTLDEIVSLLGNQSRQVGLHIEMKRPQVFKNMVDADLVAKLAARLDALIDAGIPVFFQCFDGNFLRELAPHTKAPLVYLVSGKINSSKDAFILEAPLEPYYSFVDGFGLNKALLFNAEMQTNGLANQLHTAGKFIHVWTVRNDSLPKGVQNVSQEIKVLLTVPVDGIFTDFPDTAVAVRNSLNLLSKEIR